MLPTLTLAEFKCKCDDMYCTRTMILHSTLKSYEKTRDSYNKPIRITSGYRCHIHNKDIKGRFGSYHLIGAAIDMQPWSDLTVEEKVMDMDYQEELTKLREQALKCFDVVIRYSTFIHCHNFGDK